RSNGCRPGSRPRCTSIRSGIRRSRREPRRSVGSTTSGVTPISSATGADRRARSSRVHAFVDVLLVVAGVAATAVVLDAAVRTFVVPRGTVVLFTVVVFLTIRRAFNVFASPRRTYEARDRVMAFYAPVALLALPFVSMLVVFGAFACIFEGMEDFGWRSAVMTSGSSLLTLGFQRPPDLPGAFAAFSEATIGLAILALLIAYLPTIYNTFSRREVAVTDLAIRAGTPPTPRDF